MSIFKKIILFLSAVGPGLFLVGYNIGTGSVTSMASAGANYGMSLSWAVLISCIFTYFLIITFGQYTIVTGKSALQSFKENIGPIWAQVVLWTLILSEIVGSVGVMAIITQVINEWSKPLTASGDGFNTIVVAALLAGFMMLLLFNGKYSMIEKILVVFVTLMGLSFVLTSFMVISDPAEVIRGLVPNIPDETGAGLIVAGMIGTTMGGVLYVVRSITVKEKQWKITHLKMEKRDALVSAGIMFLLSIAIIAAAAGTMHPKGLKVENAIDMVKLLEPIAGRFAVSIFVAGIVAAGVSSLFPHYMLVPLLLADYQNKPLDMTTTRNRSIVGFYALMGLFVPVFGGRPVVVMIASQAIGIIATPLILILMWILINRKKDMGNYSATLSKNILFGIIVLFTLYMAMLGVIGIINI
ncbi:MAG: Nramp family divalent metal transporter [Bacteroidota bacterium]